MKKTYYKDKPASFCQCRSGAYFRLDIKEDIADNESSLFSALEFFISEPLSENKVFEKIITSLYNNDCEQKLLNEFYSAKLELYEPDVCAEKIVNYQNFLAERLALKNEVTKICKEHDII